MAPVKSRNAQQQRPFPVITPQSYLPGSGGLYPGYSPAGGGNNFPMITPNSYLRPQGNLEPPIMNYSGGPGMLPPPAPYPPQMQYPNQGSMMGPQPPYYGPGPRLPQRRSSMRHCRRPVRTCRRSRRSRRCRPVIRIIESSSCSSLSSCSTESSCSPRLRRRSRSHSRRRTSQPQQQQPIILLPIQCQQPSQAPVQNQIQQQQQPQQIILPPIHVQQQGQFDQQQLGLQPMTFSHLGEQFQQQQPFTLPPIQFNSSNLVPNNTNATPMIISAGQPMIQPSLSLPQMATIGQPQQIQGGSFQYVQAAPQSSSPLQYVQAAPQSSSPLQYIQAAPQSSSPLQYVSAQTRSTIAPQRVLVNSTNKKQSAMVKPIARSMSVRDVPQNDLKFGRRPFDWYNNDKKKDIVKENIQVGQRRSAVIS